jgi:molybdopterin-guanine dinucleotide biosynthesis adapter protein
MKVVGLVGASALAGSAFVPDLIHALRFEGWSVSTIKRAPDGFDMDHPGKSSHARREAGCREVMLVGDRRLVLMQEFGEDAGPALASLVARLAPVDVVIAEGFRAAAIPTVEVCVPSRGREYRWRTDPNIVAVVADEDIGATVPRFRVADVAALVDHLAAALGLPRRGS